jgi:hypothetical protein
LYDSIAQSSYPKTQAVSETHTDKAVHIFSHDAKLDFKLKDILPGCWRISENEADFEDGDITFSAYLLSPDIVILETYLRYC